MFRIISAGFLFLMGSAFVKAAVVAAGLYFGEDSFVVAVAEVEALSASALR